MCNRYASPSAEDFEKYMRQLDLLLDLEDPDDWPTIPVGPFGHAPFMVAGADGGMRVRLGQWGMIRPGQPTRIEHLDPKTGRVLPPGGKIKGKPRSTNNARIEDIGRKPTYAAAWKHGRRCLIPAAWYAEPNWETGKNIWWTLKRADGRPWMLAGLWSEWTDIQTGEVVPNFTAITCNCDFHPLLGRLHKPERDRATGEILPPEKQDKRSLVHVDEADWRAWLLGTEEEARALIRPQPAAVFDQADAVMTDRMLSGMAPPPASGDLFA